MDYNYSYGKGTDVAERLVEAYIDQAKVKKRTMEILCLDVDEVKNEIGFIWDDRKSEEENLNEFFGAVEDTNFNLDDGVCLLIQPVTNMFGNDLQYWVMDRKGAHGGLPYVFTSIPAMDKIFKNQHDKDWIMDNMKNMLADFNKGGDNYLWREIEHKKKLSDSK